MFASKTASVALLFALNVLYADDRSTSNAGLFRAIRAGDIKGIQDSLRHGADANARGEHEATPLMLAAQYCSAQCLKMMLDSGADPNPLAKGAVVNAKANSGRIALMAAAASPANIEAVKTLLDAGADVKARDAVGAGAVVGAADAGDASILKLLLAKSGDPNDAKPLVTSLIRGASKSPRTAKRHPSSGHLDLESGSIAKATRGKPCVG